MAFQYDDIHEDEVYTYTKPSRTCSNSEHQGDCLKYMDTMRRQSDMIDVILVAACGIEVPAHRIVLDGCSQYFRDLITDDQESQPHRIVMHTMSSSVLQMMVDYMYTGHILITDSNVQELLHVAETLQIQCLRDTCHESILSHICPANSLSCYKFAKLHEYSQLAAKAYHCAVENFPVAVKCVDFQALTAEDLKQFISHDNLGITNEEKIFSLVISWVNHDPSVRKRFLHELIEHVRLPLLSQVCLKRIEMEPLLMDDNKCQAYLLEAFEYISLNEERKALFESPRKKPRILKKAILLIGGVTNDDPATVVKTIEYFDFLEERWHAGVAMPIPANSCGVASIGSKAYILSGTSGQDAQTLTYDSSNNSWAIKKVQCVMYKLDRMDSVAAALDGNIYVVGGYIQLTEEITALKQLPHDVELHNGNYFETKIVEMIQPPIQVILEPSMSVRRCRLGVATLDGLLYAVGGYGDRAILSSVERYNPQNINGGCQQHNGNWETVSDMLSKRSDLGVAVLNGLLYAVGGYDGHKVLRSAEVYDPKRNEWSTIADMHFCRRGAAVVGVYNLLYAIGGSDDCNPGSMEVFDPESGEWTLLEAKMITDRKKHFAVVIDNPTYLQSANTLEGEGLLDLRVRI